jgi:hypothetical protein
VWRQLKHPNILPFIGIDVETFRSVEALCVVSPWMHRGTVIQYIKTDAYDPWSDRDGLVRPLSDFYTGFAMLTMAAISYVMWPGALNICIYSRLYMVTSMA